MAPLSNVVLNLREHEAAALYNLLQYALGNDSALVFDGPTLAVIEKIEAAYERSMKPWSER